MIWEFHKDENPGCQASFYRRGMKRGQVGVLESGFTAFQYTEPLFVKALMM
jgi:hypothetical protein